MNTLAVMCMALTKQSPSFTPLCFTSSATCWVILTNPMRRGTLNVRCLVRDFIVSVLWFVRQTLVCRSLEDRLPACDCVYQTHRLAACGTVQIQNSTITSVNRRW